MNDLRRHRWLAWSLVAVGVLASAAGSVWNLYDRIFFYDEVVHGYNFFVITLLLAIYAYGVVLTGARGHGLLLVLTIGGLGLGLGALWEVAEWCYDHFIVRPNAILPKVDTIIDLVVDAVGALAAGTLVLIMLRR